MKYELHLASESPRRRELLLQAGYKFQVDSVKVSEIIDENLNPEEAVQELAVQKARALVDSGKLLKSKKNLVLAADTMVLLKGRLLGKPKNLEEARQFLDRLSGETHSVITGICLWPTDTNRPVKNFDATQVEFRTLSPQEIQAYLETGEPMGKAGAYAIQGVGQKLIQGYQGSWSNVVGLPLEKLEDILHQQGWEIEKLPSQV